MTSIERDKLNKALLSIRFFEDERIISKKEEEDITNYLSGKYLLIENRDLLSNIDYECSIK